MTEAVSGLDRRFMAAAIRLGASGLGTTWPNPSVGAIVVRNGMVVGRGRTARGGRPHAEPLALMEAGEAARGAIIYVSLEPCSHHGRTPPCADVVIAAGITRVVAAMADPDLRVAGQGFARMEAAGIDVVRSLDPGFAGRAQAGHLTRVGRGRPHVTLKLAISADDAIGRRGEANVAVTGEAARRHVQALRSRTDAILVGSGTVLADDPLLTCRLPGLEARSPVRVVLDTKARLPSDRRIFRDASASTWVFSTVDGDDFGPIRRLHAPRGGEGLDLPACLARLAEEGITRLLVEGGAHVARALLVADLVDAVTLFRSPNVIGGDAIAALAGLPLARIETSDHFRLIERRMFGPDRMTRYERHRP